MSQPDILTISSYNSIETQTASNFEAMLPNAIVNPKRMILNKFVMPNLMYDIAPNYSKLSMTFSANGGVTSNLLIVNLSTQTHWASGSDFASYLLVLIVLVRCPHRTFVFRYYSPSVVPKFSLIDVPVIWTLSGSLRPCNLARSLSDCLALV